MSSARVRHCRNACAILLDRTAACRRCDLRRTAPACTALQRHACMTAAAREAAMRLPTTHSNDETQRHLVLHNNGKAHFHWLMCKAHSMQGLQDNSIDTLAQRINAVGYSMYCFTM